MDTQQRRQAVAPALAGTQKAIGVTTVLTRELVGLWSKLPPQYVADVQSAMDDVSEAARALGRAKDRLHAITLARADAGYAIPTPQEAAA